MQLIGGVPAVKAVGPKADSRPAYPVIIPALGRTWNDAVARLVDHG
jgi:hypothetical protein